jgi:hypothetical protein
LEIFELEDPRLENWLRQVFPRVTTRAGQSSTDVVEGWYTNAQFQCRWLKLKLVQFCPELINLFFILQRLCGEAELF